MVQVHRADPDEVRLVGADRVLAVLVELGRHPQGIALDELVQAMQSPKSTVYRALASLRRAGLAEQLGRGVYVLGDEFLRIAFRNQAERPDAALMTPALETLTRRFGETTHLAVLDGTEVVYRAKVDPPQGAVRLTSVVGGRNPAYRTAVGKLLLSHAVKDEDALRALLGSGPLAANTPHTIIAIGELWQELVVTRERGYGIDDQENELGVNCVAVPVLVDPDLPPTGAVSVSALAFRTPLAILVKSIDEIAAIVRDRRIAVEPQ